jgi:coenzyme F420 biosynthesis associated uncharacterized protein
VTAVDWPLAVRVAGRVAGRYDLEGTYHDALFARQAPALIERAAAMVEAETGLPSVGSPAVEVVGRRRWIENNVAVFSRLLAPAEARIADRVKGLTGMVASRVVAAEMGAILGVLARRVLGQYELVLPTGDEETGDVIYLVGSNVLWMERRFDFRPAEFRYWIALHECTHRLQFVGVPWLREYFLGLVEELVATAVPEPGRLSRVVKEIREAGTSGQPIVGETGLFGLFATDAQKALIERVQALMSLLEGHGHVVMDRIGSRELVTQARMSRVLSARRTDPRTAAFFRLTGLEMKMRQYEVGRKFVLEVEREAGWAALDRVWEGPERLPTLEEINDPARWLSRVA